MLPVIIFIIAIILGAIILTVIGLRSPDMVNNRAAARTP